MSPQGNLRDRSANRHRTYSASGRARDWGSAVVVALVLSVATMRMRCVPASRCSAARCSRARWGESARAKQIGNRCVCRLSQATNSSKSFFETSIFGQCKLRQHFAESDVVCLTVLSGFKDYADALDTRSITDLNQVAEIIEQVLSRDFLQLG